MSEEAKTEHNFRSTLKELLPKMDVPELRQELTDENLRWLQRNLGIRNSLHKDFPMSAMIIRWLLKDKK
jgi:hypothetical protein